MSFAFKMPGWASAVGRDPLQRNNRFPAVETKVAPMMEGTALTAKDVYARADLSPFLPSPTGRIRTCDPVHPKHVRWPGYATVGEK